MPIGTSKDMLEDDFRPDYEAWKTKPSPLTSTALLKTLHPVIEGAIRTHVGQVNPLLMSRARVMTMEGLPGYEPKRGRLSSYTYNHLLGLKRANRQQTTILKVPERVAFDKYHLESATDELRATLGQEPTDDQLADYTGFSPARMAKVRSYNSGLSEGYIESGEYSGNSAFGGSRAAKKEQSPWASIVYDGLDDYHKLIMEHTLGLNGKKRLSNQDLAHKLRRSSGAVSQAKLRIQKLLDEEHELSPFGV